MSINQKNFIEKLKSSSVKKIFEEENISFAYIFWSRARGDEKENSDLDIAFYPREIYDEKNFLQLLGKLSDEIKWIEIQIINLKTVWNQILIHSVFTEWKLIYENSINKRLEEETPLIMISKEWMWRHYKNIILSYGKNKHFTLKNSIT